MVFKIGEIGQESLKYLIYTKTIVFAAQYNPGINSIVHGSPVTNGPQRVKSKIYWITSFNDLHIMVTY